MTLYDVTLANPPERFADDGEVESWLAMLAGHIDMAVEHLLDGWNDELPNGLSVQDVARREAIRDHLIRDLDGNGESVAAFLLAQEQISTIEADLEAWCEVQRDLADDREPDEDELQERRGGWDR